MVAQYGYNALSLFFFLPKLWKLTTLMALTSLSFTKRTKSCSLEQGVSAILSGGDYRFGDHREAEAQTHGPLSIWRLNSHPFSMIFFSSFPPKQIYLENRSPGKSDLSATPGRPGLESGHQNCLRQHQPHGRPHLPAPDEDPGRPQSMWGQTLCLSCHCGTE